MGIGETGRLETYVNSNMTNNGGMVWQPDILRVVIRGASAIPRRSASLIDDEGALDVYLHGSGVDESGIDLGGAGGRSRSAGMVRGGAVVGGGSFGTSVSAPVRHRCRVGLVCLGRHCSDMTGTAGLANSDPLRFKVVSVSP